MLAPGEYSFWCVCGAFSARISSHLTRRCSNHGGGYVFSALGLYAVAAWNYYIVCVLTDCAKHARVEDKSMIVQVGNKLFEAAPTYSKLAFVTLGGESALHAIDIIMVVFLFGVSTSYQVGVGGFVDGIFGYKSSNDLHGVPAFEDGQVGQVEEKISGALIADPGIGMVWTIGILVPLCCYSKDMGFLSKFSAAGLFAIIISFVMIIFYGLTALSEPTYTPLVIGDLYPSNFTNASHFFGIATFCYGIPPLTFMLRDSLAPSLRETHFLPAIRTSVRNVFWAYICLGVSVACLFHGVGVQGDIIKNLPDGGE
mgnify:FL=1